MIIIIILLSPLVLTSRCIYVYRYISLVRGQDSRLPPALLSSAPTTPVPIHPTTAALPYIYLVIKDGANAFYPSNLQSATYGTGSGTGTGTGNRYFSVSDVLGYVAEALKRGPASKKAAGFGRDMCKIVDLKGYPTAVSCFYTYFYAIHSIVLQCIYIKFMFILSCVRFT